jgi:hypothetical protein
MIHHLERIFSAGSGAETAAIIAEPATQQLWYSMAILRHGAFTGCQLCTLVCPVGPDPLPVDGEVTHGQHGDLVSIQPRRLRPQTNDTSHDR